MTMWLEILQIAQSLQAFENDDRIENDSIGIRWKESNSQEVLPRYDQNRYESPLIFKLLRPSEAGQSARIAEQWPTTVS
jgi:hypothetical protein